MLDQNTDRMWYVIGAVIIGAAIILIINGTAPKLFASVAETFEEKTEEVTEGVEELTLTDGIGPKERDASLLKQSDIYVDTATLVSYDEATNTWVLDVKDDGAATSNGMRVIDDRFAVPFGKTLTLSYEIYIPEDAGNMIAHNDINNHPYDVYGGGWHVNDNDNQNSREHNGVNASFVNIPLNAGEWTTVSFSYTNNSPKNTEKIDLYDNSIFGVSNTTGEDVRVSIRNVRLTVK